MNGHFLIYLNFIHKRVKKLLEEVFPYITSILLIN